MSDYIEYVPQRIRDWLSGTGKSPTKIAAVLTWEDGRCPYSVGTPPRVNVVKRCVAIDLRADPKWNWAEGDAVLGIDDNGDGNGLFLVADFLDEDDDPEGSTVDGDAWLVEITWDDAKETRLFIEAYDLTISLYWD